MWIVYTLICAVSLATRDALIKFLSADRRIKYPTIVIVVLLAGITTLIFHFSLYDVDLSVFRSPEVIKYLAFFLPLEAGASFLYYLAITISPLSLTVPFLTFTPALIPFFSALILNEGVTPVTYVGILLVVVGGYLLFFERGKDIFKPFRSFFKEKGSILMMIAAVVYSSTAVLNRKLVLLTGSYNLGAIYPLMSGIVVSLLLIPLWIRDRRKANEDAELSPASPKLPRTPGKIAIMIGAGIAGASMITNHFIAAGMVNAAYMISVKRTSALFALIYAHFLFREKDLRKRIVGVVLMIAGVFVIAFFA